MSGSSARHHVENEMAFRGRHARRRLVEQQHARALRQRDRDLHQTLAAIGQFAHQLERVVDQPQRVEMIERLVDHRALGAGGAPEIVAVAVALADGHAEIFQHRQPAEQLIDLEGARQPAPRPLGLRRFGDVLAIEQHTARRRLERAGDQIDQRGLAGAVRADERTPRAALQSEVDIARHLQRAEAAIESLDLQGVGHSLGFRDQYTPAFSSRPSNPRRANSTASTSSRPMPNCQNVGLIFEK